MNKRLFNQQNLTRRLRLLSVLCAMLLMPFSAWAQDESYNITVAGTPVTSQNASNITGDNIEAYTAGEPYSVSYDAASNTLSLTNARIASGGIASTSDAALNVALNNSVVLGGTGVNAISCAGDLSISAVGTNIVLYPVVSTKDGGATLTLQNGSNADAELTLNFQGSESGFAAVVYDGLYLSAENSRALKFSPSRKRFEESADAWASQIIFSSAKTYELWLGGTKVTESNKDNILDAYGYYDGYYGASATFDPDENLLTLHGMTLIGTGIENDGIISRLPNLTISVNGDNTIYCNDSCSVIRADMEGAQTLTIQKGSDGCSLTLDGSRVIRDFNTFTVTGLSWNDSFTYKYDETLTNFTAGYRLMKADGEEASRNYDTGFKPALYDESVTPYDLWVAGVQVTSANAEDICGRYIDGTVSFDAANNVLTLERTTIDLENVFNGIAVASGIADLTINLVGDNSVTPHVNTPFFAMYTGEIGATAPTLTFNTDYYLDDGLYWLGTLKFNGIVEIGSLTSGYDFTLGESPEYVDPENAGNATTGWKFSLNYDNEYLKVWKLETFDLWLDGNRVLSSDLGAGLSDGPKYNPVTERLVFSNNMTTDAPVMSSMAELTVEINGACSITPESSSPAIYFQEKGEVTSGSLTFVRGDDAVTASLTLTANGENQSMEPYKAIEGYSASDIRFGADLNLTSPTTVTEALDATTVTIGGETYYNLKVGGVYVSQTNAADVLGDGGSVTFTVTDGQEAVPTYTLTLNDATLTQPVIIGLPNLTIDIQGTNSITTEEMCIQMMEEAAPAVIFTSTSDVVGTLTLKSDAGVNNVGAYNVGSFTISDELALVLKNYGKLSSNQYYFTDGSSTTEAKFSPYYGVTVGAMQICPDNAADVIGDGIGGGDESGMVSFDKDNSILTLTNASLSGVIRSSLPDLTIELVGNNSIYSVGDRILQAGTPVQMTIQSSAAVKGSLSMHKGYSSSEKGNFVDDNVTLTISAPLAVVSGSLEDEDPDNPSNDYYATIGETYNLWVDGIRVSVANADDLIGSNYQGTMTFDAANNTLTVSEVGELPFGIESQLDALTIKVNGENLIYSESGAAISYTGKNEQATLTFVKDADSDLTSLTLTSYEGMAIDGFALDNITISTPMRLISPASMSDLLNEATVRIADYESYNISVAGIVVTDHNADAITGEGITGTVTYSSRTNTLTLDNATVIPEEENWGILYSGTEDITINLKGSNTVKGAGGCGAILYRGQGAGQDPTQVTAPNLTFAKDDAQPCSLTLNGISGFDDALRLDGGLVAVGDLTNSNQLAYIEDGYGIWVDGDQLSEHCTVTGMTYSASNHTLSLSGVVGKKNILSSLESLTVRITGTNKLGTIGFDGDEVEEGTLTFVKNDQSTAQENSLTLENEDGGGAIYGFSEVSILDPLMLKTPETIPDNWDKTSKVVISDVTEVINYDLTVAGIKVTSTNAVDVLSDGTVSYANGMLTLNDASLTSGITSNLDQLKIVLAGTNSIAGEITGTTGTLYFATDASDAKLTFTTESASAVSGFTEVKYLNGLRMKSVAGGFDLSIPSAYNLMVNGVAVTSDNRTDVFNDGTSYSEPSVVYDGEYTLILTNATLTQKIELGSDNTLDQLYIHLAGQNNTITSDDNVIVANAKPNMELHFVTNGSSPGKLVYTSTNASNPTLEGAFTGFSKVSFDNELEATLSGKTITLAQKIEPIINDDDTSGKGENANVNFTDASTGMDNTSGTNLSNTIISDILFTLNDDGTKNSPDGYDGEKVVINSEVSDEDLADAMNLEPGSPGFAEKFTGLTFKLPASTGTISIEAWSLNGHQMCVKIGDQTATYITLTDSPTTYNVDYTCSTDTYVYIYLPQPSSSSAPRRGRIGPKSGVSGGLGSIAIKSNSLVSVESSLPASSYMLLDIVAADAIISGAVRGEGLSFNDPTITALEDNMFLTGGGASSAPRRSAPALKISSDLPFIDMRGTSIKNMEVSRSSGPFNGVPENIFIYMPEGNTTSEKNVVIGDVCDRMELKAELPGSGVNEAKPFKVSKNFTAAQATLMRTFAAGGDDSKATIYLPYAIPQEAANQLGQFFEFDGIDGGVVKMTKVTGGLKANKPYIFQAKAGGVVNPEVKIVTVQGMPGETEGFKGVYEQTTCGGDNWYGYAAEEVDGATIGQFVKLGTGASIAPFRAYMVADGGVPSYAIRWGGVDDETTAIEEPEIKTVNERKPVEGWYTLTGARLVSQPTKPGLYIYNGRTVVVK